MSRVGIVPGQSPLRMVVTGAPLASPTLDQMIFDANYAAIRVLQKGSASLGGYVSADPRLPTWTSGVLAVASGAARYLAICGRRWSNAGGLILDMQFYHDQGRTLGSSFDETSTTGVGIAVDGTQFYPMHWNRAYGSSPGAASDIRYLIFRNSVG